MKIKVLYTLFMFDIASISMEVPITYTAEITQNKSVFVGSYCLQLILLRDCYLL